MGFIARSCLAVLASSATGFVLSPSSHFVAVKHGEQRDEQSVHWVFTTDCSAYMFNQGNQMLTSANYVNQSGEFTWIVYGCERDEQKEAFKKIAHPRAKAWHMAETQLVNPTTGEPYQDFQASNRPVSVAAWWKATQPKEDAIAILDPDMTWMRRVRLVDAPPSKHSQGPWETFAAKPKQGSGARYGQGCIPSRWSDEQMKSVCGVGAEADNCVQLKTDYASCSTSYSSGPPWILNHDDAEEVYGTWLDTAVKTHEVYPELLAEQVSYGVAQMKYKINNNLEAFWFLSSPGSEQPWDAVNAVDFDPCAARAPPPADLDLPPLFHACSTFNIPYIEDQGFRLHKDHIHKDILDCDAPLLHYPPLDALEHYCPVENSVEWRNTWSVCTYTNLVNFHVGTWKKQFCEKPNLEPSFSYPPHSMGALNEDSWLTKTFRRGGWADVDYTIGRGGK